MLLSLLSFGVSFVLTRRDLGLGVCFALIVGCAYGIVRAWSPDIGTYFWFDATVLGIYAAAGPRLLREARARAPALRSWVIILCIFPVLLILLSPFFDTQPPLVQLLGLRASIFFVPLLLLGPAMDVDDWRKLALTAAFLAIVCAAVAGVELVVGVNRLFPENPATRLILASNDLEGGAYRIPSTFLSSHLYGGTMLALMPLILTRVQAGGHRVLTWAGLGAAALGVLISGARTPVVLLAVLVAAVLVRAGRRIQIVLGVLVLALALGLAVPRFEQFRRVETLQDPELVSTRVESSVNVNTLDLVLESPLGRGLASAFGTSIPYFMQDQARPQIAIENEYARIATEQGLPGLGLWLSFILWALWRRLPQWSKLDSLSLFVMWTLCLIVWGTASLGGGLLAAVPATLLVLLQMGAVASATNQPSSASAGQSRSPALRTVDARG